MKSREPASLSQYRQQPNARYEDYPAKDELREALVSEQRGICCYCLSQIKPTGDSMRIEHWHPRDQFPGEQLDYKNLLGACSGEEGQGSEKEHCDISKHNRTISRNPANPNHAVTQLIRYLTNGDVVSTDAVFDTELNKILNLNCERLRNSRKRAIDGFTRSLGRGTISREKWERHLERYENQRMSVAFSPVIVYLIRKKLARH